MSSKSSTIDERFDKVDDRFNEMRDQFTEVNKQLDRIATTVVKGFVQMDKKFETKADKSDVERLLKSIDSFAKRLEISDVMNGSSWVTSSTVSIVG